MRSRSAINLNDQQGFTLIEILIAITILGVLMASIYTIISNTTETKERIVIEDRELLQVQSAFHRIDMDLSQIYSPTYFQAEEPLGEAQKIDSYNVTFKPSEKYPARTVLARPIPTIINDNDYTLGFLTGAHRRKIADTKESNLSWILYTLRSSTAENKSGEEGEGYELIRYSNPTNIYTKDFFWDEIKPQILLRSVKSLKFFFWSDKKEDYVQTLRELGESDLKIRAIKMELVWVDSDNSEQTFVRIFRPLWPYFDTKKDEQERQKALKPPPKKTNNNNNTNVNTNEEN